LKVMNFLTNTYEKIVFKSLRKKALDFIIDYIHDEDIQTSYINIGPVNQVINSLCVWHKYGSDNEFFKKHVERWYDYLWVAEDGMKMQGYNGAQLWETAFTANAILEHNEAQNYLPSLQKMYQFIDSQQIKEGIALNNPFFRNPNLGGWPFSIAAHGWPITDCTADGIKAAIKLDKILFAYFPETHIQSISQVRLEQAVDLILGMQNVDGGWTSYEKRRAPKWIEVLNPSEVYGEIMVDYTYVECTSSVVQGLSEFHRAYPTYKPIEIKTAISEGIQFIKKEQWEDGAWYGSWGVCFTYAAWFGLEALACINETYKNSEAAKKGCDFLVAKQRADGGWGESYKSCVEMRYIEHEISQIIQTAWALLGLMAVGFDDKKVLHLGINFIISRQEQNGDFPQEAITGVFNKNCMETYTSYRNVFPIWALARYESLH
jgi:squalene/oxidosqualene cyclase-like protein